MKDDGEGEVIGGGSISGKDSGDGIDSAVSLTISGVSGIGINSGEDEKCPTSNGSSTFDVSVSCNDGFQGGISDALYFLFRKGGICRFGVGCCVRSDVEGDGKGDGDGTGGRCEGINGEGDGVGDCEGGKFKSSTGARNGGRLKSRTGGDTGMIRSCGGAGDGGKFKSHNRGGDGSKFRSRT